MLLGAMCAYVLARFKFPFNRAIYYLMLACLTFPIFLAIVPLFQLMAFAGGTLPGLIVVYVAFALRSRCSSSTFFPSAARRDRRGGAVDGAGEWRTFFQVMPRWPPGLRGGDLQLPRMNQFLCRWR